MKLSQKELTFRYALIATSASIANLLLQKILIEIFVFEYAVEFSIVAATAIILPIKYFADKRYIFIFETSSLSKNMQKFAIYTLVSVFTVGVFWGCELMFFMIFKAELMTYLGGAIGLALSFFLKYQLDKRFVFK